MSDKHDMFEDKYDDLKIKRELKCWSNSALSGGISGEHGQVMFQVGTLFFPSAITFVLNKYL